MRKYAQWAGFLIAIVFTSWALSRQAASEVEQSTDWLPWLGLFIEVLGKVDWLNALLVGGGFVVLIMLVVWQITPGDGFDMRAMFAVRAIGPDGRERWVVSPGRVFQTGSFCVTTWAFVYVVTHDKLTEFFVLVYAALWSGTLAMNQIIASKFPVAPGTALPDVSSAAGSVTTTTTTEVKP